MIPGDLFKNKYLKWLDIGAGKGAFTFNLFDRLYKNLDYIFIDPYERKKHIIENMLYMVEIYEPHIRQSSSSFFFDCSNICLSSSGSSDSATKSVLVSF